MLVGRDFLKNVHLMVNIIKVDIQSELSSPHREREREREREILT